VRDFRKQQLLETQLDKGESSAIALAIETPGSTIILDDYKAKKIATQLGLAYTGTIGVIVKAKRRHSRRQATVAENQADEFSLVRRP
jgi:predicted nucleic acid-binding protein